MFRQYVANNFIFSILPFLIGADVLRFRRIDASKVENTIRSDRLKDQSYSSKQGDNFASKAADDLIKVRGKDFRKEMQKKKRSSWRGVGRWKHKNIRISRKKLSLLLFIRSHQSTQPSLFNGLLIIIIIGLIIDYFAVFSLLIIVIMVESSFVLLDKDD